MAKVIVAFSQKNNMHQLASALEASGYEIFRTCATGHEVMRAFNQCQDGILVCGTHFVDRTVNDLAYDLEGRALILAVGRSDQLDNCDHPDLFKLPMPFTKGELKTAVDMLVQLHYKRLPRRNDSEREIISRAKEKMMAERGIGEVEAHHLLQQASMRRGIKMVQSAMEVLSGT